MPPGIMGAPLLEPGHEFYLHAYLELTTCRPVGFAARPIPWTAIREYAETYAIEDFDEFRAIIMATDAAVLADAEAGDGTAEAPSVQP